MEITQLSACILNNTQCQKPKTTVFCGTKNWTEVIFSNRTPLICTCSNSCYHKNGARSRNTRTAYRVHSDLVIHSSLAVSRQLITAAPFQHVIVGSTSWTQPTHTHKTIRRRTRRFHIDTLSVVTELILCRYKTIDYCYDLLATGPPCANRQQTG